MWRKLVQEKQKFREKHTNLRKERAKMQKATSSDDIKKATPNELVNDTTSDENGGILSEVDDEHLQKYVLNEVISLFTMLDVNGDGRIQKHEVQSFFNTESVLLDTDDVDDIIRDLSKNKDETYIEFNDFFEALKDDFSATITEKVLRDVFEMMDVNKDGVLSAADLQATFRKLGHHVTIPEAQEVMCDCDLDSDGLLYFDEFCVFARKNDKLIKMLNVQRRRLSNQSESFIIEMESEK